ncbi:MAG: acyl-CoA dehydrogenase family protein [Rhodococcus sp. (in: high G+C Gram-positive bacteria)]
MHIAYTPEQNDLRGELRRYFERLLTPERRAALSSQTGEYGSGSVYRDVVRDMGKDGWLALGWPEKYGGRGRPMIEQLIFADEAAVAGAPVPFLTLQSVAPTIMHHGTEEQREYFLPRIAAGELHFAIGYSEAEAGTDLASLRTTAHRDGDEFVIDGAKMWTSLIAYADYIWLACRTNSEAPKHRGISVLVVPADADGVSWTPVHTMAGPDTSATYYSGVRVPDTALVGPLDGGWALITDQLNDERVALTPAAPIQHAYREVLRWATSTRRPDGRRVADSEWVQLNLARVHAKVSFLETKNWELATSPDRVRPADASASKVFGTELAVEAYRLLMEILGPTSTVRQDSAGAHLRGSIERRHRAALILTFGGGTNEVQRDIIARTELALPSAPR